MTLLVTIFLLVLLTEVIEWIGKPVLQQLVRLSELCAYLRPKPSCLTFIPVLWDISLSHFRHSEETERPQEGYPRGQAPTVAD